MSASDRHDTGRENRDPRQIEAEIARTRAEMSETLDEIQQRFSPGHLMNEVVEYLRAGPGGFAANFGTAVRNNPVPVALVGAGLAWLMASGSRGSRRASARSRAGRYESHPATGEFDPYYDAPYYPGEGTGEGAGGGAMRRAREAAEGMRDSAAAATGQVRESVGSAMERVRERVGGAGGRLRDTTGHTRERLGEAARGVRKRMHRVRSGVSGTAGQVREMAMDQAERARGGVDYLVHEQPLALAGIGLAIGAALGAGLPGTRRENELLGDTRDEILRRASAFGSEKLRGTVHAGKAGADAAVSEAERQGLSVEGGKEQARAARQKIEKVAAAARDAAREEAEKEGLAAKQGKPETS